MSTGSTAPAPRPHSPENVARALRLAQARTAKREVEPPDVKVTDGGFWHVLKHHVDLDAVLSGVDSPLRSSLENQPRQRQAQLLELRDRNRTKPRFYDDMSPQEIQGLIHL